MSKVGVIDIGTNTVLCLKAEVGGDAIDIIFDSRFHYRAGRRLDDLGNISAEYKTGMRRALILALETLKECSEVKIVATEVLRKPKDGAAFAGQLSDEVGYRIEIIEPQREAELSFFGAISDFDTLSGKVAMLDVGGGSSELAIGEDGTLQRWSGVRIGAVSLSEAVGYGKPLDDYLDYADRIFADSDFGSLLESTAAQLILVGGSAVTLAGILNDMRVFDADKLSGFEIRQDILSLLMENLSIMTIEKRKQIIAFDPQRAEIIVPGGAIITAFMNKFGFDSVKISTRGLRHGLLLELFG
jgi:exopolyphosphatase/guanosine-5'-triphosphate,3'-diphosphate pyrophosphatase